MSFLLAILLAWTSGFAAGECPACQSTGRQPCVEHPPALARFEADTLYCTAIADCTACGGTGFKPCKKCGEGKTAQAALEARRAQLPGFAKSLKPLDDAMGRPLRKAESDHFVLVWEVDEIKMGQRRVQAHEALHVYLSRLEQLFDDYTTRLGVDEKAFLKKSQVFVWYLPKDHQQATAAFCSASPEEGGVKLLGLTPRYTVCVSEKAIGRNDEKLHRDVVHVTVHLLLSHEQPVAWIGNMKSAWADEGLAHWFEDRVVGVCDAYCCKESEPGPLLENGRFRLGVRKAVAKKDAPALAQVVQLNSDALLRPLDAFAFSYVDYLLSLGGEKFDVLVRKLKAQTPVGEAVQAVYGVNLLELEARWKAWVLETYPTR